MSTDRPGALRSQRWERKGSGSWGWTVTQRTCSEDVRVRVGLHPGGTRVDPHPGSYTPRPSLSRVWTRRWVSPRPTTFVEVQRWSGHPRDAVSTLTGSDRPPVTHKLGVGLSRTRRRGVVPVWGYDGGCVVVPQGPSHPHPSLPRVYLSLSLTLRFRIVNTGTSRGPTDLLELVL